MVRVQTRYTPRRVHSSIFVKRILIWLLLVPVLNGLTCETFTYSRTISALGLFSVFNVTTWFQFSPSWLESPSTSIIMAKLFCGVDGNCSPSWKVTPEWRISRYIAQNIDPSRLLCSQKNSGETFWGHWVCIYNFPHHPQANCKALWRASLGKLSFSLVQITWGLWVCMYNVLQCPQRNCTAQRENVRFAEKTLVITVSRRHRKKASFFVENTKHFFYFCPKLRTLSQPIHFDSTRKNANINNLFTLA